MFERFSRREGKSSKDKVERISQAPAGKETERILAPKPFHAVITSERTPIEDTISAQKQKIIEMLQQDTTGQGSVVVLVENTAWLSNYGDTVQKSMAQGKSFTDADRDAYAAGWIHLSDNPIYAQDGSVDIDTVDSERQKYKSPLSYATDDMLDELISEYGTRIQIQPQEVLDPDESYTMRQRAINSFDPFDEYHPIHKAEEALELKSFEIAQQAEILKKRREKTAKRIAERIAEPNILGVVGAVLITDIGISDVLESDPDIKDTTRVKETIAVTDKTVITPTERLLQYAQREEADHNALHNALLREKKQHEEELKIHLEVADIINAAQNAYIAYKNGKKQSALDAEFEQAASGVFPASVDAGETFEEIERTKREQASTFADRVSKAIIVQRTGKMPDPATLDAMRGQSTDMVLAIQQQWELKINDHLDTVLSTTYNPSEQWIHSSREYSEKLALSMMSKIAGKEITDVQELGAATLEALFIDPVGYVGKVQEHAKSENSYTLKSTEAFALDFAAGVGRDNNSLSEVLSLDTEEKSGKKADRNRRPSKYSPQVAREITQDILKKKGYSNPSGYELARYQGETQQYLAAVQAHYEKEVARLTSKYLDAFAIGNAEGWKDISHDHKVQVRAAAEKAVLDSIKEIAGTDIVVKHAHNLQISTKSMGELMLRAAIADPEGVRQRAAEYNGKEPSVQHGDVEMTIEVATGFGLPTKEEYTKALEIEGGIVYDEHFVAFTQQNTEYDSDKPSEAEPMHTEPEIVVSQTPENDPNARYLDEEPTDEERDIFTKYGIEPEHDDTPQKTRPDVPEIDE